MIDYKFGDVILVPFPFTDQSATKKRPAVVISSSLYHQQYSDIILMAITSQTKAAFALGELFLKNWQVAGLLKPSAIKPIVTTIEKKLISKRLGQLETEDREGLIEILHQILNMN